MRRLCRSMNSDVRHLSAERAEYLHPFIVSRTRTGENDYGKSGDCNGQQQRNYAGKQGKELGIYVLPMPFFIDGKMFLEDITLTQEQFYEKAGSGFGYFHIAAFAGRCDGAVGELF